MSTTSATTGRVSVTIPARGSGHVQVPVPGMPHVTCDADIAPLIAYLNARGYTTVYSCQGDPSGIPTDRAYIMLADGHDLENVTFELHTLAVAAGFTLLGERILGLDPNPDTSRDHGAPPPWSLRPTWNRYLSVSSDRNRPAFAAILRFDHRDLATLVSLLPHS